MNLIKNFLKSFIVIFVSFSIGILLCEIILRVKHNFLINYDIEMWRYAKELKQKVANDKKLLALRKSLRLKESIDV